MIRDANTQWVLQKTYLWAPYGHIVVILVTKLQIKMRDKLDNYHLKSTLTTVEPNLHNYPALLSIFWAISKALRVNTEGTVYSQDFSRQRFKVTVMNK